MATIGPHVSKQRAGSDYPWNIRRAVAFAKKHGYTIGAVAIHFVGPRGFAVNVSADEADELKKTLVENKLVGISHSSYINLPWSGKRVSTVITRLELALCDRAGFAGAVIHIGSATMREKAGLDAAAESLRPIINRDYHNRAVLYIEQTGMKKAPLADITALRYFFDAIDAKVTNSSRVGLCIDTAHMWVGGVDLRTYASAKAWFAGLAGFRHPVMLHLNDCSTDFGCGKDAHAPLGHGKIWGGIDFAASGLAYILEFAKKNHIPMILERAETNGLDLDYALLAKVA